MDGLVKRVEKFVVLGLLVLMLLVVVAGAVELVFVIYDAMAEPPRYMLLDINELLRIFGFFLLILIGLELVSSIKNYLADHTVHVEVVMVVALIAVSRKIIVIDYDKTAPMTLVGMAALIVALTGGYFLLKRVKQQKD